MLRDIAYDFARKHLGTVTDQIEGKLNKGPVAIKVFIYSLPFYVMYAEDWFYSAPKKFPKIPTALWLSCSDFCMDKIVEDKAVIVSKIQKYEYWLYGLTWKNWSLENNTFIRNNKYGYKSYLIPVTQTQKPPEMSGMELREYFKPVGQLTL
jgi:hypothetical protein